VPYTGSSVLASALAMDKLKAKEIFRLHNLQTPSYYVHRRGAGSAAEQHASFGFPAVVKPRAEGSSLGVARVEDLDELELALDEVVSDRGNEYVLEIDTLPSLAPHGLLPKIAHATGHDFGDLCEAILSEARLHAGGSKGASRVRRANEVPAFERARRQLATG